MASGKLTPLGDPAPNAPKWFADGDGGGVERTEGRAVAFLMGREKVRPAVMDELPERRGAGAAGLMDGRHKECVSEHLW